MTSKEITSVAIKVFAIYLLFSLLSQFPGAAWSLYSFSQVGEVNTESIAVILLSTLSIVLMIAVVLAIWRMSSKILAATAEATEEPKFSVDQIFLLALFGLYLTFEGLFSAMRIGMNMGVFLMSSSAENANWGERVISEDDLLVFSLIVAVLKSLVGLTFVFGSRFWTSMLFKARQFGMAAKPIERD